MTPGDTKHYYVYIMASLNNNVLYTGITSDILRRVFIHKSKITKGFSKRYNVSKLVYFEETSDVIAALEREKQIKAGSREKKELQINSINPQWDDLYGKLV